MRSFTTNILAILILTAGCDQRDAGPATSSDPSDSTATSRPATQSIIPVVQLVDWCGEHAMPESICVQCNRSLAADFKAKGDWDEAHNLPKSQCFECDPTLKGKFAAEFRQKYGKAPPAEGHSH